MTEPKIDGFIKEAYLDGRVMVGDIFFDKKKRFIDGTRIRTSRIVELKGDIVRTLNSTYKFKWA